MALTIQEIVDACNSDAGSEDLAQDEEYLRWWNEGQARLGRHVRNSVAVDWAAGDLTIDLPLDFLQLSRFDYDAGITSQEWRLYGRQFLIDSSDGATADGTAIVYYIGERTPLAINDPVTDYTNLSEGSYQEDYACIAYAGAKLFRRIAANRVQYTRYSTLLGANAVTVAELQNEADRLMQDYEGIRLDLPPQEIASFYEMR